MIKVHPLELKSEHWLPGTYLIKGDNYLMGEVPVLGKHKVYELNKPLAINWQYICSSSSIWRKAASPLHGRTCRAAGRPGWPSPVGGRANWYTLEPYNQTYEPHSNWFTHHLQELIPSRFRPHYQWTPYFTHANMWSSKQKTQSLEPIWTFQLQKPFHALVTSFTRNEEH